MKRRMALYVLAFVMILSCVAGLTGCGSKDSVTIGSKQFTENILLGEMYAQLIEAKSDIKVNRKLNLGGTSVCMPAIEKGEIDIYFEYTGTAFSEILGKELQDDSTIEGIRQECMEGLYKDHDITMFDPLGMNNTYAIAVKADRQSELGVSKISDLTAIAPQLSFGSAHTFYTRVRDGYDGLVSTYDVHFKEALKMDTSLLYEAADKGELDVIVVFATDSLLRKYGMYCLEDDLGLFPPYEGAPICRNETLKKHPELKNLLNTLASSVDDTAMQELNYKVDVLHESVEKVAKEFLTQNGYL